MKIVRLILLLLLIEFPIFGDTMENLGEGIFIQRNITEENSSKPRIAIATAIINSSKFTDPSDYSKKQTYEELVHFATRSKEIYARKHQYDFVIATEKLEECYGIPTSRPLEAAWTKLALIARLLDDYDWVFWSDADSVILNFSTKLETFLDPEYALIACDISPNQIAAGSLLPNQQINSGEVFYQNVPLSHEILKAAWDDHHIYTLNSWDQERINRYLQINELFDHVYIHPQKAFNTPPEIFELGDFIVHFYSYHGKFLKKIMDQYENDYGFIVDEAERSLEK